MELVRSETEGAEERRFRQRRRKKSAERPYYRKVFRGIGVGHCFVLGELELTAIERVRWEAVDCRVESFDTAQLKNC